jgi:hypothetical protein
MDARGGAAPPHAPPPETVAGPSDPVLLSAARAPDSCPTLRPKTHHPRGWVVQGAADLTLHEVRLDRASLRRRYLAAAFINNIAIPR